MSQIIAFKGGSIPGVADPDIVAELERLLEEAKSGDLQAIAYCTVRDDEKGTGWVGMAGTRDSIAASIAILQFRYCAQMLEGE